MNGDVDHSGMADGGVAAEMLTAWRTL